MTSNSNIKIILLSKFFGSILERNPQLSAIGANEFLELDYGLMLIESSITYIYIIENQKVFGLQIYNNSYKISCISLQELNKRVLKAGKDYFNAVFWSHAIEQLKIDFDSENRNSVIEIAINKYFDLIAELKTRPNILELIQNKFGINIIESHPHISAQAVDEFLALETGVLFMNSTTGNIYIFYKYNEEIISLTFGDSGYNIAAISVDEIKLRFIERDRKNFKAVYAEFATRLTHLRFRAKDRNMMIRPALNTYFEIIYNWKD